MHRMTEFMEKRGNLRERENRSFTQLVSTSVSSKEDPKGRWETMTP